MATVLIPNQTFFLHLRTLEDTTPVLPAGSTVVWRSNDPDCTSVSAIGDVDALATAHKKGSATISCEVLQDGVHVIVLRESVRVDQPDLYKLTVDTPV